MYLNFFVQKGLLFKRMRDWDVILGLTAIATVLLITSTTLTKFRTWNYRLFFYLHVITSISLLPILYLHVSHLRIYILEAGALYVLLIIQRNTSQASADANIKVLPNTNLIFITIPLTKALSARTFTPGQHIYLGFPSLEKLRINPFSIANPHPHTDKKIHLVARTLSGTTAILSNLAKAPQPTPLLLEGPYGSSAKFPDFAAYDRILFVAGGVGATFTLPIYTNILQRAARGEPMPATRFVWTVRKDADAQWGIDQLRSQLGKLPDIELHISHSQSQTSSNSGREHQSSRREPEDVHGIEMQQLAQNPEGISDFESGLANIARKGRPDLKTIVDETFEGDTKDRVAVLVCGPSGMGKSLRMEVWEWVRKGRDVFWHNEEFGW